MSVVVFVHALGSSGRAWDPQREALAERFTVIAPDLPGHGERSGLFSLESAADAVSEIIAGEPERVSLVGISVGATVALLTALVNPDKVAKLVLSAGVAHTSGGDQAQRSVMRLMPQGVMVKLMTGMYAGGRAEYRAQAAEDLRLAGKPTLLNGLNELTSIDLRPRLAEIKQPTLVLCGDKDKPNISLSEDIAEGLPNAELRIIPDAGHIWNLQQPKLFSETVADFIG